MTRVGATDVARHRVTATKLLHALCPSMVRAEPHSWSMSLNVSLFLVLDAVFVAVFSFRRSLCVSLSMSGSSFFYGRSDILFFGGLSDVFLWTLW